MKRSVAFDRGAEWGFEGSFVVYPFSVWAVPALLDRCLKVAARVAAVAGVSLAVAGCGSFDMGMGDLFGGSKTDRSSRLTQADIDALNRGGPRVAMLLPLSAPGEAGEAARALKEAGELALFESGQPNIILEAKDTQGTPQGAQAAANEAISGGARLIVGPLLSSSVKAVTPLAQSSGIPVVAFSTDQQAASNGVYLLSFLPEQEVDRVVEYAIRQGRRRIAALLPQSPYGAVVERALTDAVQRRNGRLVAIERYAQTTESLRQMVQKVSTESNNPNGGMDALLIDTGGDELRTVATMLTDSGFNRTGVKLLGTSLWDDATVGSIPVMIGAWYAGPPPETRQQFAQRFRNAYGRQPPRVASLAYDAVSLANALAGQQQGDPFTQARLTEPSGFAGVDGVFRFLSNGLNQRGLAVMEITVTGSTVIDPPPRGFTGAGS